jgi:mevalonate kinase
MKVILLEAKPSFQIRVPGKWILAGEHSVLRGGDAIVFPLSSRYLDLTYLPRNGVVNGEFEVQLKGKSHSELELIIWSVIEKALKKLNLKRSQLTGTLKLESHILFGAGMGASATLCVALTEFFSFLGYISAEDKYSFATDLENLFHGESSGVDVAVTLFKKPLLFSRTNGFTPLEITEGPQLYLSHTGERGVTKDCVDKVKKLFQMNPDLAEKVDQQMKDAVQKFKKLLLGSHDTSHWVQALEQAHDCYEQWGLVNEPVHTHANILLKSGALAIKLTGSGGGGYMLSYWKQDPPSFAFEMIPCFHESLSQK